MFNGNVIASPRAFDNGHAMLMVEDRTGEH